MLYGYKENNDKIITIERAKILNFHTFYLFVCSCCTLFIFATSLIRTCSTFSHATSSCLFSCFLSTCASLLSWFNYFLITWIFFYSSWFMLFYFCRSHCFFFSILCQWVLFSTDFCSRSTFFIFSFLLIRGCAFITRTCYFIFSASYFIFSASYLFFNF